MTKREFIKQYFITLPTVLTASSAAILIPSLIFIIYAKITAQDTGYELYLLPLMFWGFGHLIAAPGLLLAYLPTSIFLQKKKANFVEYVSFSSLYAFLNGIFFPQAALVFLVVGFLTGAFHFISIKNNTEDGKELPSIPPVGYFLIVVLLFSPIFINLMPEKKPCSSDITTNIAGIKLQVPRAYSWGKAAGSNDTYWKWSVFVKPDGETYVSRMEEGCNITDVAQSSIVKMPNVSYADATMYGGTIKPWADRRLAEINSLDSKAETTHDGMQVYNDPSIRKTYIVLPIDETQTASGKPVIFMCDKQSQEYYGWCKTSYMDSSGLLVSYDFFNDFHGKNELVRMNTLVKAQLNELINAAENPEQKKASFLLQDAFRKNRISHGPRCDGHRIKDLDIRNLTVKVGESYYRTLNKDVRIQMADKTVISKIPCHVEYIEGVSFTKIRKGTIASLKSEASDALKKQYEENKHHLADTKELNGIKEIDIGHENRPHTIALLSQNIAKTSRDHPAIISCINRNNRNNISTCTLTYQPKESDILVSYGEVYDLEKFDRTIYSSLFKKAEKWVNEMKEASNDYYGKTGYH